MKTVLSAVALLAAASAPTVAFAQDAPAPFQGLRVEGLLGVDRQQSPYPGEAGESDGLLYGVGAGYDVRRGNLVFGGEAELTGASTDTRGDGVFAPGDRLVLDSGRDIYLGGRVGFVIAPTVLAYGKLGYTNAHVDRDYQGTAARPDFDDGRNSGGVRVGAGAEVAIAPATFVKGEYRYSDYGSSTIEHRHQILAGFGFRF